MRRLLISPRIRSFEILVFLEVLDLALVLLGLFQGRKCAKVAALAG